MHLQFNTLKYATILKEKGFNPPDADSLMSTLVDIEFFNLYNQREVDEMLAKSVREVFAEQRREFDTRMKEIKAHNAAQLEKQSQEFLSSRRWMIGTLITIMLALPVYLSALFHFLH